MTHRPYTRLCELHPAILIDLQRICGFQKQSKFTFGADLWHTYGDIGKFVTQQSVFTLGCGLS